MLGHLVDAVVSVVTAQPDESHLVEILALPVYLLPLLLVNHWCEALRLLNIV